MKCYNLKNKVAVITGASRGIGQAISIKLANQGAITILISRNISNLKKTAKIIKSNNGKTEVYSCDISNYNNFNDIINKIINNWGKIDILVNNAGITKDNLIIRMNENEWDEVIDINLKGCFNSIKAVSRSMIKNKTGSIVNISSVIGLIGNTGQSNYAASKAGIIGLTKSIAKELGSRNITINCIAPGYINTDMTDKLNEEQKTKIKNSIPLKKFGTVDDIANLTCFLISEDARYITGQTFNVDGGMVMI